MRSKDSHDNHFFSLRSKVTLKEMEKIDRTRTMVQCVKFIDHDTFQFGSYTPPARNMRLKKAKNMQKMIPKGG